MDINVESLTEQFVTLIRNMILNNELKPGDQIPTQKIAEQYGVSVMPVRSALRELADRKLVVNRSRVGFFVCDYTVSELMEISNCRRMYETYCLKRYFDQLDIDKLKTLYNSIKENTGDNFSLRTYQTIDTQLHSSFILASSNSFLIEQYKQLSDLFSLGIRYDNEHAYTIALSNQEHLELLESIFNGDYKGALQHLHLHLDRADQMMLDSESGNF